MATDSVSVAHFNFDVADLKKNDLIRARAAIFAAIPMMTPGTLRKI
jgi:hypothetical protein